MTAQLETLEDLGSFLGSETREAKTPGRVIEEESSSPEAQEEQEQSKETVTHEDSSPETQEESANTESKEESTDPEDSSPEKQEESVKEPAEFLKMFNADKPPETVDEALTLLEKAAKIVKDTRSAQNEDHKTSLQSRKELEAKETRLAELQKTVEDLQEKVKTGDEASRKYDNEQFLAKFTKDFDEDPSKALQNMILEVRREVLEKPVVEPLDTSKLPELISNEILAHQEKIFQKANPDYPELMEEFIPVLKQDRKLQDQWDADGRTPEAAYKLAKAHREAKQILSDPEAYKAKLREEWEKENNVGRDKKSPDKSLALSNITSKRTGNAAKSNGQLSSVEDLMDSMYPG